MIELLHVGLSLPILGCALVSVPGPGMWDFGLVERCCVFASLVLVAFARVVGLVVLLVWLGCIVFLCCFIRWFCVGLKPLSYIFRGGAACFSFFLGAFGFLHCS